ncbi:PIN domain-like protein [Moniliophthora roreri]|nr:PIN domain-like protein [Moniliophthora roreri]
MGLKGWNWGEFDSSCELRSFSHLAVVEGFHPNNWRLRGIVVGVDAWPPNPLRPLFFRLCKYVKLAIGIVWVYDGSAKPQIKRGTQVNNKEIAFYAQAWHLLSALGFEVHNAPGEAEAELAELNHRNIVDCVMSDDIDTLIFGAQCLIQIEQPLQTKKSIVCDDIYIYTSQAIKNDDQIGLTHAGLIFMALVSGGDYHNGLQGFGIKTAIALTHCGFGDSLENAMKTLTNPQLDGWQKSIRHELYSNSQGHMANQNPSLADCITDAFPDLDVLNLYLNPVTSWSPGKVPPDTSRWYPHLPHLWLVAQFAVEHLFPSRGQYLRVFHKHLFEGLAYHLIAFGAPMYDIKTNHIVGLLADAFVTRIYPQAHIYTPKVMANSMNPQPPAMHSLYLRVSSEKFIHLSGANPETLNEDERSVLNNINLWIPEVILQENIPPLLSDGVQASLGLRYVFLCSFEKCTEFAEIRKSQHADNNTSVPSLQETVGIGESSHNDDELVYIGTHLPNGQFVKIVDTIEIE